jgi:hypothetical protein
MKAMLRDPESAPHLPAGQGPTSPGSVPLVRCSVVKVPEATPRGVQTDVRWLTGDLPSGVRGSTGCAVLNGSVCDRNNVTIDIAELNIGTNDEDDQTKTTCHELGHTVGLTHGGASEDCMISGERPSTASQWEHYGSHHTYHINLNF